MIASWYGYGSSLLGEGSRNWNRFWFAPRTTFDMGLVRIALGFLAAIYAASWYPDLGRWIADDGLLPSSVTRFLIGDQIAGTGSIGRLSPLYLINTPRFVSLYLAATIVCSIAMAIGFGGRWLPLIVWLLTLGIVHRVPMLQAGGDFLFSGLLGYLVIDPGKTRNVLRRGIDDREDRWTSNLALRLIQCQVIGWLMISFISHLAEPMWWSGQATWWLASAKLSPWLDPLSLSEHPYQVNSWTYLFLLFHIGVLVFLLIHRCRPLALIMAIGLSALVWGLAGDWFYAIAIFLCLSCVWGTALRELRLTALDSPEPLQATDLDRATPVESSTKTGQPAKRLRSKKH